MPNEQLPRQPDAVLQEAVDLAEDVLVGETGHRWARPRYTRAGRTVAVSWSGMNRTEALALFEFLRAHRHVAWAPRSEDPRAWLISTRPTMAPSGDSWQIAAGLTELLWTGP